MSEQLRYQIRCPGLPLAVYREIAVHLRQVEGVEAGLIPQISQQFDYMETQAGGLWIEYAHAANSESRERVKQILTYYQNRYGAWKEDTAQVVPSRQGLETKS